MAKSIGSAAKSSSRRCFTFVNVTTPTAPRTPLPTKFAVAEKHKGCLLRWKHYICWRRRQNISTVLGTESDSGDTSSNEFRVEVRLFLWAGKNSFVWIQQELA